MLTSVAQVVWWGLVVITTARGLRGPEATTASRGVPGAVSLGKEANPRVAPLGLPCPKDIGLDVDPIWGCWGNGRLGDLPQRWTLPLDLWTEPTQGLPQSGPTPLFSLRERVQSLYADALAEADTRVFGTFLWREPSPFDPDLLARLKANASWSRLLLEEEQESPDFNGQASSQLEGPWGSLKSQLQVEAVRAAEVREAERWQAEENLQVPVTGPLYVYGQVSANYNTWTAQQKTLSGRTGVGCKLKPLANSEIILSGGSVTNYSEDPLQPRQLPVEKSQLIVELQARYSVLGALKLEYQGSAMPALSTLDHNRVQQDFRFALPLGSAGDVRIGAKHQWEDIPGAPRPWTDSMQLYFGLGLKR